MSPRAGPGSNHQIEKSDELRRLAFGVATAARALGDAVGVLGARRLTPQGLADLRHARDLLDAVERAAIGASAPKRPGRPKAVSPP
jgi:hypothetical protein